MARRTPRPMSLLLRKTRPPVASASECIVSWFADTLDMVVNTGAGAAPLVVVAVAVVGFNAGIRPRMSTGYTAISAVLIARAARLSSLLRMVGPVAVGMTIGNAPDTQTRFFLPGMPAR